LFELEPAAVVDPEFVGTLQALRGPGVALSAEVCGAEHRGGEALFVGERLQLGDGFVEPVLFEELADSRQHLIGLWKMRFGLCSTQCHGFTSSSLFVANSLQRLSTTRSNCRATLVAR